MKIYYQDTGLNPNIIAAVYEKDLFSWNNTIQVPVSILAIDEVDPANKGLCIDIVSTQGRMDTNGRNKFSVNSSGELVELLGWQEAIDA
ncbi:MAG: hypothetical protein HYS21_13725 [Deltaproteobacteria bacterium]|nr:hypothetical protein [Deltaproteobacteria bacterium]